MPETRLFLERGSYRRRRMMDAVRSLPLLCTFLFILVPLMWPKGEAALPLSTVIWYLFTVWVFAIVASFALWLRIRRARPEPAPDEAHGV